jgi:hypothetical protein
MTGGKRRDKTSCAGTHRKRWNPKANLRLGYRDVSMPLAQVQRDACSSDGYTISLVTLT